VNHGRQHRKDGGAELRHRLCGVDVVGIGIAAATGDEREKNN